MFCSYKMLNTEEKVKKIKDKLGGMQNIHYIREN